MEESEVVGVHRAVEFDHLLTELGNELVVDLYYDQSVHRSIVYLVTTQRTTLPIRQRLVLAQLLTQHLLRNERQTAIPMFRIHRLEQLPHINHPHPLHLPHLLVLTPHRLQQTIHIIVKRMSHDQSPILNVSQYSRLHLRNVLDCKTVNQVDV